MKTKYVNKGTKFLVNCKSTFAQFQWPSHNFWYCGKDSHSLNSCTCYYYIIILYYIILNYIILYYIILYYIIWALLTWPNKRNTQTLFKPLHAWACNLVRLTKQEYIIFLKREKIKKFKCCQSRYTTIHLFWAR